MPASEARKRRRAMKAQGVELVERNHVPLDRLDAVNRADRTDLLVWEIARAVKSLAMHGADYVGGKVTILVGQHPSFPGSLTIEAKADRVLEKRTEADALADLAKIQAAFETRTDDDGVDDESAGGLIAMP